MQIKTTPAVQWWLDLSILCFAALGLLVLYLGSHVLLTPDEARYTEVAREMLARHDFITPMVNGVAFLDKPALFYWLQASSMNLFGINEWAIRLWPALFGVIGVAISYIMGRKLFNRTTGLLAAMILLTSPLYFFAAHYVNMDLEVAVLITGALSLFLIATQSQKRTPWLLAAYVCAGLAILTKGLMGIIFPMMIIGAWIMLRWRWRELLHMRLLLGVVVIAAIVMPWFIAVQHANPQFLHFFFVVQHFSRFLTQHFNNGMPVWFYLPVIVVGMLPWSLFLWQGLRQQYLNIRKQEDADVAWFLLLWPLLIFIFFSIPSSKIVGYILPVLPPLAIITGYYLYKIYRGEKSGRNGFICFQLLAVMLSFVLVTLSFLPKFNDFKAWFSLLYIMAVILFIGAVMVNILRQNKKKLFAMAVTVILLLATLMFASTTINFVSVKPFIATVNAKMTLDTRIVSYHHFYQDLPLYLGRNISIVTDWDNPDIMQYDNWKRELIYGIKTQPKSRQWMLNEEQFWTLWNKGQPVLVFLATKHLKDFTALAKLPVYVLQRGSHISLVSNSS